MKEGSNNLTYKEEYHTPSLASVESSRLRSLECIKARRGDMLHTSEAEVVEV
jgi:hypothetical protein